MKREIKKVTKMVDEVSTFFLENQGTEIDVKIVNMEDKIVIAVIAKYLTDINATVAKLKEYLSYPRAHEMEEYYWELTGESECEEGLAIVGSMVDEAVLDYTEEEIYIQYVAAKRLSLLGRVL